MFAAPSLAPVYAHELGAGREVPWRFANWSRGVTLATL
jgi:hypothetical protein